MEKYDNVQNSTMGIPTVIGLFSDSKISWMKEAIEYIKSRNEINEGMRNMPSGLLKYAEEHKK